MAFGVITFVPIIFLYLGLFKEEEGLIHSSRFIDDFNDSFKFLLKDKVLLKFGIVLGIFNSVGALFPAYLKLQINTTLEGQRLSHGDNISRWVIPLHYVL